MKGYKITLLVGICCLLMVYSCQEQKSNFNTSEELKTYPEVVNEHINAAFKKRQVLSKYILDADKRKMMRETLSQLSYEHKVTNVCQLIEHIDPDNTMLLEVANARCDFYKTLDDAIKHSNMTLSEISNARAKTLNPRHIFQKEDLGKHLD